MVSGAMSHDSGALKDICGFFLLVYVCSAGRADHCRKSARRSAKAAGICAGYCFFLRGSSVGLT